MAMGASPTSISTSAWTSLGVGPATVLARNLTFYYFHGSSAPTADAAGKLSAGKKVCGDSDSGYALPNTDETWVIAEEDTPANKLYVRISR